MSVDAEQFTASFVIVVPGEGCIDTSTGLPLTLPINAPAGCPLVSLYSTVQTFAASAMAQPSQEQAALAIRLGLAIPDPDFDVCAFDPLANAWAGTECEVTKNYLTAISTLIGVTSQIASVVGYQSADQAVLAGSAVLADYASQLVDLLDEATPPSDVLTIWYRTCIQAMPSLVDAAETATEVSLDSSLEVTLVATTRQLAEFLLGGSYDACAAPAASTLTDYAMYSTTGQVAAQQGAIGDVLDVVADSSDGINAYASEVEEALQLETSTDSLDSLAAEITPPEPVQLPGPPSPPPVVSGVTRVELTFDGSLSDYASPEAFWEQLQGALVVASGIPEDEADAAFVLVSLTEGSIIAVVDMADVAFTAPNSDLCAVVQGSSTDVPPLNTLEADPGFACPVLEPTPPPPSPSPSPDAVEEKAQAPLGLLALLILLIPIAYVVYVKVRFNGQVGKYYSWRFSHSSPYVVWRYMPEERRTAFYQELFRPAAAAAAKVDSPVEAVAARTATETAYTENYAASAVPPKPSGDAAEAPPKDPSDSAPDKEPPKESAGRTQYRV